MMELVTYEKREQQNKLLSRYVFTFKCVLTQNRSKFTVLEHATLQNFTATRFTHSYTHKHIQSHTRTHILTHIRKETHRQLN